MFARNRAYIMLLHNQLGLPTCLIASRTLMVCCSKKLGSRVEYQHQSWARLNARGSSFCVTVPVVSSMVSSSLLHPVTSGCLPPARYSEHQLSRVSQLVKAAVRRAERRFLSRIGVMIRGSGAGSATVVRPTTAKLSRPQIMDPSWSLNIDMTTIQLSTLEEVETVLTKPRRLHLQATVAAATKKRGGRKSVARPLGNNSSTNKKITSNKIPVAVDFLPQE
ncbi:unnamed protein product, partial [Nesidiocoris tenuis]